MKFIALAAALALAGCSGTCNSFGCTTTSVTSKVAPPWWAWIATETTATTGTF